MHEVLVTHLNSNMHKEAIKYNMSDFFQCTKDINIGNVIDLMRLASAPKTHKSDNLFYYMQNIYLGAYVINMQKGTTRLFVN